MRDLPDLLEPGDLLVLNDTRVLPTPAGRPARREHGRGDAARPRAGRPLARVRAAGAHVPAGRSPGVRAGFFRRGAGAEGEGGEITLGFACDEAA